MLTILEITRQVIIRKWDSQQERLVKVSDEDEVQTFKIFSLSLFDG